jgi:hypothetical protein
MNAGSSPAVDRAISCGLAVAVVCLALVFAAVLLVSALSE